MANQYKYSYEFTDTANGTLNTEDLKLKILASSLIEFISDRSLVCEGKIEIAFLTPLDELGTTELDSIIANHQGVSPEFTKTEERDQLLARMSNLMLDRLDSAIPDEPTKDALKTSMKNFLIQYTGEFRLWGLIGSHYTSEITTLITQEANDTNGNFYTLLNLPTDLGNTVAEYFINEINLL
jgi:hypothetical protein